MNKQRQLLIGLGVIAILLVVIIVVVATSPTNNSGSASTPATGDTAATAPSTGAMTSDGGAVGMNGEEVPFDEATATKIPADSTPKQWVDDYYKACDAKDWETAQKHLPAAKQQVTSAADLATQLEGYGIVGYQITGENDKGDTLEISADQETESYGTFTSIWTFVKGADGDWLLKNKVVAGMGQ